MKEPEIRQVEFRYNGDAETFEQFMKALISEHLISSGGSAFEIEVIATDSEETIVIRSA